MNRTVTRIGGLLTAVAVILLLVYALQAGGGTPFAQPSAGPSATAASAKRTTTTRSPRPARSTAAPSDRSTVRDGLGRVRLADLPPQARRTVALIDAGGPFPYAKDGATFNNFEGVLPKQPRGYYREYTVPTPGERDRGARRIVTGDRDRELFYTADHYETFARVQR